MVGGNLFSLPDTGSARSIGTQYQPLLGKLLPVGDPWGPGVAALLDFGPNGPLTLIDVRPSPRAKAALGRSDLTSPPSPARLVAGRS